jgi:PEP-CTERM motif
LSLIEGLRFYLVGIPETVKDFESKLTRGKLPLAEFVPVPLDLRFEELLHQILRGAYQCIVCCIAYCLEFQSLFPGEHVLRVAFGAPFSPSSTVDFTSLTGNWAAGLNAQFPLTTTSPITVSLWPNASGEPNTELESWSLTVDELATNYTLTSTTSPLLVAGDTYWVLADYTNAVSGNNFLGWGVNSAATTLGLWFSDSSATTLGLVSFDNPQPALEVQGTAVPEPSALMLLCVGFVCVLVKSIRQPRVS